MSLNSIPLIVAIVLSSVCFWTAFGARFSARPASKHNQQQCLILGLLFLGLPLVQYTHGHTRETCIAATAGLIVYLLTREVLHVRATFPILFKQIRAATHSPKPRKHQVAIKQTEACEKSIIGRILYRRELAQCHLDRGILAGKQMATKVILSNPPFNQPVPPQPTAQAFDPFEL